MANGRRGILMRDYIQLFEAERRPEKISLVKLPYDTDALEPVLSQANVKFHYQQLSQGYVDRYNSSEGDADFNWGGAQLHNLWWAQLQPPRGANRPHGEIAALIEREHGSFEEFKENFSEAAQTLQGSGWCYLSRAGDIRTLRNQDFVKSVLLPVDLWEHSWQYDVANPNKQKYLENIWRIINWQVINHRIAGSA
jgi:superoxide dismutase, Fe-Mn family